VNLERTGAGDLTVLTLKNRSVAPISMVYAGIGSLAAKSNGERL
jgi:hypothetical protein